MIQEISIDEGTTRVLDSIIADRLAILVGAGLSMPYPSCLPSAAAIAATAKQKFDAIYGASRPPLPVAIEDQAEYFFQRGELETIYFRQLIDAHAFAGRPNAGHIAAADLLLVRALQIAITTNVDTLVEAGGQSIYGQIEAGLDGHSIAALPPDISPLLKLHGCRTRDFKNMVWAPGQLNAAPISDRIASSTAQLSVRLLNRDLLIVGYWSDWDYLNGVLEHTLGEVTPSTVIVVNPADSDSFEEKAPQLYALGQKATTDFFHVRQSGSEFLDSVRKSFSKSYIRRTFHLGIPSYLDQTGTHPDDTWLEPPDIDNTDLWEMRRDIEGRPPNEPALLKTPPQETLLGMTVLQLRAAGATSEGSLWKLKNQRIRVLRAANTALHLIQEKYTGDVAPIVAPDFVIAVGAESLSLPQNVVRSGTSPTIARGNPSEWITRSAAIEVLGL